MAELLIIGAGLAGLSAGYHAERRGIDYGILEAGKTVGGLCRTVERDGFLFDFSGHLLHLKDPYFKELVDDLLPGNLDAIRRNAAIFSHGVYTRYPFQANLFGLPPLVIKECLQEFVKAYYTNDDLPTSAYGTFREWIEAKLGAGIGRHFMFPYNEKLWTVPTDRMTCDWLSEYVPKPDLEEVFTGAFEDQTKGYGYNAAFRYPRRGGIQTLCDALAARTPRIRLGERVVSVDPRGRKVRCASGREERYERLISTMPLKTLGGLLEGDLPAEVREAAGALRHNSVMICNVGIRGDRVTDKHWIYLPEPGFAAYRAGCYSNFSGAMVPPGTSSFYLEIAYQREWNVDKEALVSRAIDQMADLGFLRSRDDVLVTDVMDVECAYVIYDHDRSCARRTLMEYLNRFGIHSIGRYGNWEYSGMEEAMMQGRAAIEAGRKS
jgi:protoporphyrinogen oxidase